MLYDFLPAAPDVETATAATVATTATTPNSSIVRLRRTFIPSTLLLVVERLTRPVLSDRTTRRHNTSSISKHLGLSDRPALTWERTPPIPGLDVERTLRPPPRPRGDNGLHGT